MGENLEDERGDDLLRETRKNWETVEQRISFPQQYPSYLFQIVLTSPSDYPLITPARQYASD
jgi:hypothetical protein